MGLPYRNIVISQDMIDAYRTATRDSNPLHELCALGKQETFILEQLAQEQARRAYRDAACARYTVEFKHPIPSNTTVTIELVTHDTDNGTIAGRILRGEKTAATGTFTYVPNGRGLCPSNYCTDASQLESSARAAHIELGIPASRFTLSTDDAFAAALGIGSDIPALRPLAVGLSSAALLDRGKDLIFAEREQGNAPVYTRHDILLFPNSLDMDTNDELCIFVSFAKQGGRDYRAFTFAENQEKSPLYAGTLDLTFVPERIVKRMLR